MALFTFFLGGALVWLFFRIQKGSCAQQVQTLVENEYQAIDEKIQTHEKKKTEIEATLKEKEERLKKDKEKLKKLQESLQAQEKKLSSKKESLEKVSGMSREEAKEKLLAQVERENRRRLEEIVSLAEEQAEERASEIIASAMQRLSTRVAQKQTQIAVPLPHEEMKGKIIGKEGRNSRAFEEICGVNLTISHGGQEVLLSSFDPIRLYTSKLTLEHLFQAEKIHPKQIEKSSLYAERRLDEESEELGLKAASLCSVEALHPEIIRLLGKLHFRYSFGQNVLDHSVEVAQLMGLMAEELGWNSQRAQRIGLLHDIGKSLPSCDGTSHALLGLEVARRYGESEEVANGVGCHHKEVEPLTREAQLLSVADSISAARPGARKQDLQRLKKLEEMALTVEGVEEAYVTGSGHAIHVIASKREMNPLQEQKIREKVRTALPEGKRVQVVVTKRI